MNQPIRIETYEMKHLRTEIRYDAHLQCYQYAESRPTKTELINTIQMEDWAMEPANSFHHRHFNWRHYLFENAVLEANYIKRLSETQFRALLLIILDEFQNHHRLTCHLSLKGPSFELVVKIIQEAARTHETLRFVIQPQSNYFKLYIEKKHHNPLTTEVMALEDILTEDEWRHLFTFMNTVAPQVINPIKVGWKLLKRFRPLDVLMTYTEFSFDSETHEICGMDGYIGERNLPLSLSDLPEESLDFLTKLVMGFPLGVNI